MKLQLFYISAFVLGLVALASGQTTVGNDSRSGNFTLEDYEEQLTDLSVQLESAQATIAGLENERESLQSLSVKLQMDLTSVNSTKSAEIATLTQTVTDLLKSNQVLSDSNRILNQALDSLKLSHSSTISSLISANTDLEHKNQLQSQQITILQTNMTQMNETYSQKIQERDEAIQSGKTEYHGLLNYIADLQKDFLSTAEEYRDFSIRIGEATDELRTSTSGANDQLLRANSKLRAELENIQEVNKNLTAALESPSMWAAARGMIAGHLFDRVANKFWAAPKPAEQSSMAAVAGTAVAVSAGAYAAHTAATNKLKKSMKPPTATPNPSPESADSTALMTSLIIGFLLLLLVIFSFMMFRKTKVAVVGREPQTDAEPVLESSTVEV